MSASSNKEDDTILQGYVYSAKGLAIDSTQSKLSDQQIKEWIHAHAFTSVAYVVVSYYSDMERLFLVAYAETACLLSAEDLARDFGPNAKLKLLVTKQQYYQKLENLASVYVPYLWASTDQRFEDVSRDVLARLYLRTLQAPSVRQKKLLRQQHDRVNERWNFLAGSTLRELTLPF